MKKKLKWLLFAIIAMSAVCGGLYYKNMPVNVACKTVEPKTVELDFTEVGVVAAPKSVEVYAVSGGKLEEVSVSKGQAVKEGDALCTVDSSRYLLEIKQSGANTKAISAQRDNLAVEERRRRDALASAKRELQDELNTLDAQKLSSAVGKEEQLRLQSIVIKSAEAELARTQENAAKSELLYENGALPKNDYEAAKKAVEYAQTALEQAKQQVQLIENSAGAIGTAQYDAMKQALLNQISGIDADMGKSYSDAMYSYYTTLMESEQVTIERLNKYIDDCVVTAPVSGIVTELFIEDTNMVSTTAPVALITPEGGNVVEAYVSTKDLDVITPGYRVQLQLERRLEDKNYEGTVTAVDDKAVIRTSALGVEERRVKVTVEPDEPSEFSEGHDVNVKFVYYRAENMLSVPKTALFSENGQDMVWLATDGFATKAPVQKGAELRTEFVIESGLSAGDVIVIDSDSELLREGVKVSYGE